AGRHRPAGHPHPHAAPRGRRGRTPVAHRLHPAGTNQPAGRVVSGTVSSNTTAASGTVTPEELDAALAETTAALFQRQRSDGSWEGRLSASPGATADVLIAM